MTQLRRLLKYLRGYRRNILLNIISNILMALFTVVSIPAIIPFLQILFDQAPDVLQKPKVSNFGSLLEYCQYQISFWKITYGRETTLLYICGFILIIFFFKNLFKYLSLFFMAPVRNGIVRDIRQELFDKLLYLPLAYFSEERKGDLMSRMSSDVQEIEWGILNVLEALVREPLIIIGCLFYMLYVSPSLTLFVLILLVFTAFIIGGIGKRLKQQSSAAQQKLGNLVAVVEEAVSGLRIIKGFNAEAYQQAKFAKENEGYKQILTQILWRRDLSSPLSEFLGVAVVTVLLWYGSRLVFDQTMEAATFFSFLFAFFTVINPSKSFASAFYNVQKGLAAVDRVDKILLAEETIQSPSHPQALNGFDKSINYQQVYFSYGQDQTLVLQNITLEIPKGKTFALVGSSGAGKSTLADLLARFYDVDQGAIFIDGIDIRQLALEDLRRQIGIVSQEAILFNDTIYNNIVFGQTNISEAAVIRAATIAHAHEFIEESEHGYQTIIGDRGVKLSGGQRQRLTIARAILRDPAILILDEATSALDSASEQLVQEAMQRLLMNRTAIVIAHRLSTIQNADQIIVLEGGKIIERGTHEQLLEAGGAYRKLVELQAF